MRWVVNLAKPTMAAMLIAAPIGNTTVLLLFSLSLETLLTLLLFRERRWRLETTVGGAPVVLLHRTVPHLRARHPVSAQLPVASSRWRTAPSGATSQARGKRAASGPVERHVPVAGL